MESNIRIEITNGKANLYTPYNKDFVSKVKLLGARWDGAKRCWTVNEQAVEAARKTMREIYGMDDQLPAETVDVVLTFHEALFEGRGSIMILGREIARAFGRDSGARVGENVIFLEGKPDSAGSMKNWDTYIPAGSVVRVIGVPKTLTEDPVLPNGVEMKIDGVRIDREALEAEREQLLKRLAEIEELLK